MKDFKISKKAENVVLKDIIKAARVAMANSYSPYSECKVGAALVSAKTGEIYSGCNVENSSYGATICAERNAITTAVAKEKDLCIALIVIVTNKEESFPPCGICLQTINEFACASTQVVLLNKDDDNPSFYDFIELLPNNFSLK